MPLIVTDDIEAAANMVRPMYALYFGGMGAKSTNFHANVPIRMGYEARGRADPGPVPAGQEGRGSRASRQLIEQLTLIGPKDKIRHELEAWRESIVTTLLIAATRRCCAPPLSWCWADALGVVVQRELPRMRAHPDRVDLVLALVADVGVDQPGREHVALRAGTRGLTRARRGRLER